MRWFFRKFLPTAAAAATLACGGKQDGEGGIPAAAVVGTWHLTVGSMAGTCAGAAGGGQVVLDVDSVSAGTGNAVNVIETWGLTDSTTTRTLTGHVDLDDGEVDLRLWHSVLSSGAQLVGTLKADGSFTGSLIDPIPGFSPMWVVGSCTFPVTGHVD